MTRHANSSTGRALLDAALAGGAQATGVDGGLAVGRPADIVSLDAGHPALVALFYVVPLLGTGLALLVLMGYSPSAILARRRLAEAAA